MVGYDRLNDGGLEHSGLHYGGLKGSVVGYSK